MSKVQLQGNASGTGIFTIASPNSNTDRTQTLPDNSGTIVTTGSTGVVTQSMLASGVGGKVLQVVNVVYSTLASSTTSTYVDTGLSASITPSSSSSKILVLVDQGGCGKQTNNTRIKLQLLRGASSIQVIDAGIGAYNASTTTNFIGSISIAYLDSPSTTSSTTYKTQFASYSNLDGVFVQTDGSASSITLMEIAA
jgi:hypothetical protein